jgi:hypothetical protein
MPALVWFEGPSRMRAFSLEEYSVEIILFFASLIFITSLWRVLIDIKEQGLFVGTVKVGEPDSCFGQLYTRRVFLWIPAYINGSMGWLRFAWDIWWIDDKGKRQECSGSWSDPRDS